MSACEQLGVSQLTGILCQVDPRQRGIPTSNSKKSSTFPFLILCHVETDENVKFHRGKQVFALQLFLRREHIWLVLKFKIVCVGQKQIRQRSQST